MKYLSLMLIALLLTSCAAQSTNYPNNTKSMSGPVIPMTPERRLEEVYQENLPFTPTAAPMTPPPIEQGMSGWEVLGTIVALPVLVPLFALSLAMSAPAPHYHGVHCRSYTYKDQYHTNCY